MCTGKFQNSLGPESDYSRPKQNHNITASECWLLAIIQMPKAFGDKVILKQSPIRPFCNTFSSIWNVVMLQVFRLKSNFFKKETLPVQFCHFKSTKSSVSKRNPDKLYRFHPMVNRVILWQNLLTNRITIHGRTYKLIVLPYMVEPTNK